MKPAADALRDKPASVSFGPQAFPVVNNIDVAVTDNADALRDAFYRQAFGPVRWVEVVQALKARGVTHLVECGPGKGADRHGKRIDAELKPPASPTPATLWLKPAPCWLTTIRQTPPPWALPSSPAPVVASAAIAKLSWPRTAGRDRHRHQRVRRCGYHRGPGRPTAAVAWS